MPNMTPHLPLCCVFHRERAFYYDAAQEQDTASSGVMASCSRQSSGLNDVEKWLGTIIRIMSILVGVQRAALYDGIRKRISSVPRKKWTEWMKMQSRLDRALRPVNLPFWTLAATRPNMLACHYDEARGLNAWLAVDTTQDVNLGKPNALCLPSYRSEDDLYGVMIIEKPPADFASERAGWRSSPVLRNKPTCDSKRPPAKRNGGPRTPRTEVQLARQIQKTFLPIFA